MSRIIIGPLGSGNLVHGSMQVPDKQLVSKIQSGNGTVSLNQKSNVPKKPETVKQPNALSRKLWQEEMFSAVK
jgi:hypothetical protein